MARWLDLGPFRLDTETNLLLRDGAPVALGPRAVAVLRVLAERADIPVSKEELFSAAWPGLAVEDSNLTVQIAALRRALADGEGGVRWIETLFRRGYRYVGPSARGQAGAKRSDPPAEHAGRERREDQSRLCPILRDHPPDRGEPADRRCSAPQALAGWAARLCPAGEGPQSRGLSARWPPGGGTR